jgi:uridine kinase
MVLIDRNNDKMAKIETEFHRWQDLLNIHSVHELNRAIDNGHADELILVSEALQEKKIAAIAEEIVATPGVKFVLISGPSSSGKTTFSKRLSIQLFTCGVRPYPVSLDDYFVDREHTPHDEQGEYDFESLYAINIELFNRHLTDLLNGKPVELPRYNFQTGKSEQSGEILRPTDNQVIVLEGIHALNPQLTPGIPEESKFHIFDSTFTSLDFPDEEYGLTPLDYRLLRRIIRDHKYRGYSAEETIKRWASVRRGEEKWILPFSKHADAFFNSALIFELAVIRNQAINTLEQVPVDSDAFNEAQRLHRLLSRIHPISEKDLPSTSLLREFLGGSSFKY